jgi:hypothetical protein
VTDGTVDRCCPRDVDAFVEQLRQPPAPAGNVRIMSDPLFVEAVDVSTGSLRATQLVLSDEAKRRLDMGPARLPRWRPEPWPWWMPMLGVAIGAGPALSFLAVMWLISALAALVAP